MNALNRLGAMIPHSVLTPPSEPTTTNVGTNVTDCGIISVTSTYVNTARRPGTLIRASAYPAIEPKSVPTGAVTIATRNEFQSECAIGTDASANRSPKLTHDSGSGSHDQSGELTC